MISIWSDITNECRAQIKLYEFDSGRQYLYEMFDCSYLHLIALKVKRGKYRINAETYQGKSVGKTFTKGPYINPLVLNLQNNNPGYLLIYYILFIVIPGQVTC